MHEYMLRMNMFLKSGELKPGDVGTAQIGHDSWCDLLHDTGDCNCNPEIIIIRGADVFEIVEHDGTWVLRRKTSTN